jgi:hypothetical protein
MAGQRVGTLMGLQAFGGLLRIPFFDAIAPAKRVLIAGAGGGFDVFSGLPLYFALRAEGKEVFLANLSFSNLPPTAGRHLLPTLVEVTADAYGSRRYFPEKHLSQWFRDRGSEVPIYCFHRDGVAPMVRGYKALQAELNFDTVILVDGGTDSLMRGDEAGLGTPQEDMASIAGANSLDDALVPRKFLVCLGFGVDTFHGVCHTDVLEAVARLSADGGYLGAFSLTLDMPAVQEFRAATQYVQARTIDRESIVCASIVSAIEGQFGDHHATRRTEGSELFINPLMSMYWCFQLRNVARQNLYLDRIVETEGYLELSHTIERFRIEQASTRPWRTLPM